MFWITAVCVDRSYEKYSRQFTDVMAILKIKAFIMHAHNNL